ncbi:hypothetical protein A4A58_24005 [Tardiphaga robiniae]|uniref:Uncharacterized protein n=1 Tax=Tardiphaga robiniae TaxID=943830 RepID=A0A161RM75_9BRAD|nr:hypothetical protein A4A58_24005 [Tardiphaga robiniae]
MSALRTALIWPVSVDSETARPPQTVCRRCSCHSLCPVLDRKEQQIERLRSNSDELGTSLELGPIGVLAIIFE